MGNRTILPSKTPGSNYFETFDMSSLLATGEAVGSAVVSVSLLIGDDMLISLTTVGSATVNLNVVTQRITGGLPGNTYLLRVAGTTNQGNVLITLANISVVSSDPYGS